MKKIILLTFFYAFSMPAWSEISIDPLINKITFQLNSETWLTTKTALVTVAINASLADQSIENLQNEIMGELKQFSTQGEWHLIDFHRQLDKSGLESIQIMAQNRLAENQLGNLRDKAKTMSKPGKTFTIDSVQFTPSEDEIKQANVLLRNNIYQQAKNEIDNLNKIYPDQKYYLHQIDFNFIPEAQPMAAMMMNKTIASGASESGNNLAIGNKASIHAVVTAASFTQGIINKITTP